MIHLNIEKLLEEKGKTKYWLWKQTDLTYTNFDNLVKNRTKSIRYDNLEKICRALECTPSELFTRIDDDEEEASKKKRKKKAEK